MKQAAHILYHHRTRAQDAQGIHIRALSGAFRNLGHKVSMVGLVNAEEVEEKTEVAKADDQDTATTLMGVEIPHWLYECMALGYNGVAFANLSWNIVKNKPDLVYERYSMFTVGGYLAAKLFRVPFVLEVNAPLSLEQQEIGDLQMRGLAQWLEDFLCRNANATIVVTEAMKGIFVERGLPADKFVVMPNGVDRTKFNPQVDGSAIREQYGLQDRFVAGFLGWIRPWHGVDLLVQAVEQLSASCPDMSLLVVGDGPAVPALREQVKEAGLEDRVYFTGPVKQDDVPKYLAAMDVTVQPNVTDYASPIKLFEYLAMGKAVIAPNKPNIREVVEPGKDGLLFEVGSSEAIAEALKQLYDDRDLLHKLSAAAVDVVERRGYFWENNAESVLKVVGV